MTVPNDWLPGSPLLPEGQVDDAIHIDDPRRGASTLCGEKTAGRNVVAFDRFPRPDAFAGCWTCLTEAEKRDSR